LEIESGTTSSGRKEEDPLNTVFVREDFQVDISVVLVHGAIKFERFDSSDIQEILEEVDQLDELTENQYFVPRVDQFWKDAVQEFKLARGHVEPVQVKGVVAIQQKVGMVEDSSHLHEGVREALGTLLSRRGIDCENTVINNVVINGSLPS